MAALSPKTKPPSEADTDMNLFKSDPEARTLRWALRLEGVGCRF